MVCGNGSGKTTCFILGMLSRVDPKLTAPQALCICPTRELAIQALVANPKCSLLVAKDPEDRTDLIITLHGDVVSVNFGDFQFVRIEPKVVRYVLGVATASLGSGEFSKEGYRAAKVDPIYQFSKPIASHMNKDHAEDTKLIVQHSNSIPVGSVVSCLVSDLFCFRYGTASVMKVLLVCFSLTDSLNKETIYLPERVRGVLIFVGTLVVGWDDN
ncbi:DEAD-box ATP-dependent RNA helicase 38 [Camellia lanceoleosa]|uniref:DEAD-box ATP-dependent RNA helicase 38 n=1 Tax=Camellia lanceoleosa TaxID=1840588 RepID=A0ACC0G8Q4_9ERIC|nr:DEAD-box ATP-dependent RNA helicase 38 [Camellia lanceoleosa]